MENLPPKSPTTDNNILTWPDDFHPAGPSWPTDFAGFSAIKRRAHRRSISDVSLAFVEEPGPARDSQEANGGERGAGVDDEAQLIMAVLGNEAGSGSENSSATMSQKRRWTEEGSEAGGRHCPDPEGAEAAPESPAAAVSDPKRVKRILANRQSAQRSRVRKLQYISELERSMTRLQTEVSMLSPRVAYVDHQRMMLNVDNTALKSKIAALSHDKLFKDAHQEALKREIERLKQVYQRQNNVETLTPSSNP